MKNPTDELSKRQFALKQKINSEMVNTFPAYAFHAIGRGLERIFRLSRPPHWMVSVFVGLILTLLPGILIELILFSRVQWSGPLLFYLTLIPFGYLYAVVAYVNLVYVLLPGIRDHVVDAIISVDDLHDLESWLGNLWSIRKWLWFSLSSGLLVGVVFIVQTSRAVEHFIGIGLAVITLSVMPFFIGPLYFYPYVVSLPVRLARYRLKIYNSNPANSEVIHRFINTLNIYLYIFSIYYATGLWLESLHPITSWWIAGTILIGLGPTVIQFFVNQYAVREIIARAKWRSLNDLQEQIENLREKNLESVPETTIVRINSLMDLHDRISAKPSSTLNWNIGFGFLNQLLLPLLGLLLGNLSEILRFLKP